MSKAVERLKSVVDVAVKNGYAKAVVEFSRQDMRDIADWVAVNQSISAASEFLDYGSIVYMGIVVNVHQTHSPSISVSFIKEDRFDIT